MHPLMALATSAAARKLFQTAAAAIAPIVTKFMNKGYVICADDVLAIWAAVRGKVGLAIRNGSLKKSKQIYRHVVGPQHCDVLVRGVPQISA